MIKGDGGSPRISYKRKLKVIFIIRGIDPLIERPVLVAGNINGVRSGKLFKLGVIGLPVGTPHKNRLYAFPGSLGDVNKNAFILVANHFSRDSSMD